MQRTETGLKPNETKLEQTESELGMDQTWENQLQLDFWVIALPTIYIQAGRAGMTIWSHSNLARDETKMNHPECHLDLLEEDAHLLISPCSPPSSSWCPSPHLSARCLLLSSLRNCIKFWGCNRGGINLRNCNPGGQSSTRRATQPCGNHNPRPPPQSEIESAAKSVSKNKIVGMWSSFWTVCGTIWNFSLGTPEDFDDTCKSLQGRFWMRNR